MQMLILLWLVRPAETIFLTLTHATTASAQQTVGSQTIAAQNQEVFIYGMRSSDTLDLDTVKIDLNAGTALTSPDGTAKLYQCPQELVAKNRNLAGVI